MAKSDWPNTYVVANRYGQQAVTQMKNRLRSSDKDGGELEQSIKYKIVYTDNGIEVQFRMSKTADYVEQGRKAYGDDRTHDPPVVKRWQSSKLKLWMSRKGIDEDKKYAISRSIGRYGIEPFKFRFITNTLWRNYQSAYEKALAKDFEVQLQKIINEEFKK